MNHNINYEHNFLCLSLSFIREIWKYISIRRQAHYLAQRFSLTGWSCVRIRSFSALLYYIMDTLLYFCRSILYGYIYIYSISKYICISIYILVIIYIILPNFTTQITVKQTIETKLVLGNVFIISLLSSCLSWTIFFSSGNI